MVGHMLDLHRLAVFVSVVERKSVSQAAGDLYLSQPAVSKHIKALEKLYGVRLLERSRRPVTPTEAGRIFYRFAKSAMHSLEDLDNAMKEFNEGHAGALAIGASGTTGQYLLPPILARFKQKHPGADLRVRVAAPEHIYREVQNGELQLGVTSGTDVPRDLASEVLGRDELVLVAAPGHPLAGREGITAQELAEEGFVHSPPGTPVYELMMEPLVRAGITPRMVMTTDQVETAKRAVQEGLGVSFLFRIAVEREIQAGHLCELRFHGLRFLGVHNLIYSPTRYQSALVRRFLSVLRKEAAALLSPSEAPR